MGLRTSRLYGECSFGLCAVLTVFIFRHCACTTSSVYLFPLPDSFVKQYYDILSNQPALLYRFYAEGSTFSHAEEEDSASQFGVEAIRKRVEELNYLNAEVDLSDGFIDVQKSSINSVESILVIVTGHFSLREIRSRPFSSSFILAKPERKDASYYVHNSVFRLISDRGVIEDGAAPAAQAVSLKAGAADPASSTPQEEITRSSSNNNISKDKGPSSERKNSNIESSKAAATKPAATEVTKPPQEGASSSAGDTKSGSSTDNTAAAASAVPKSYADMAKKISAAPVPAPAPTARTSKHPGASGAPSDGSSKDDDKVGASKGAKKSGGRGSSGQSSENASMYVRYLTSQVTEADLRDVFDTFGDILRVDISNGKGFAFIDFSSRAALMAVLASNTTFTLHGANLKVEERSSKASPGSGGKGSGSGDKEGGGGGGGGSGSGGGGAKDSSGSKRGEGRGKQGGSGRKEDNGEGKRRSGGASAKEGARNQKGGSTAK